MFLLLFFTCLASTRALASENKEQATYCSSREFTTARRDSKASEASLTVKIVVPESALKWQPPWLRKSLWGSESSSSLTSESSCDDGACVSQDAVCDGKSGCADDNDEAHCDTSAEENTKKPVLHRGRRDTQAAEASLIDKIVGPNSPLKWQPPWLKKNFWVSESPPPCVLPEYPDRGSYTSVDQPEAKPGQEYSFITLIFSCRSDYALEGSVNNYCSDGVWQHPFPTCVRLCRLNLNSSSVEYNCQVSNTNGGTRPCNAVEPAGTVVEAKCRIHFYSPTILPVMRCLDGDWDYMPQCVPECGKVAPEGSQLVAGGTRAKHGELPWHVGVYKNFTGKYRQICGGTIVSKSLVISAAHCFWSDATKLQNASLYAVAAGKIYRPWDEQRDTEAQKSNVSRIIVPDLFFGAETHYDYDLALVILTTPFEYKNFIGPVCLSFNMVLEAEQLTVGSYGKVAGWGFTSAQGIPSGVLQVVDLPYMDEGTCLLRAPVGYRDLITSQKFCAGSIDGKTVCKGDSGGGLVFPSKDLGVVRYYLRGVVSTAPRGFEKCDTTTITTFSHLSKLEKYIRPHLTID